MRICTIIRKFINQNIIINFTTDKIVLLVISSYIKCLREGSVLKSAFIITPKPHVSSVGRKACINASSFDNLFILLFSNKIRYTNRNLLETSYL